MKLNHLTAVLLAVICLSGALPAKAAEPAGGEQAQSPAAPGGNAMSTGEVRKVDKDAGKITLRHGPLENLGMPAMTMVFTVKDPAMLDQVKAGDKVRFTAENSGGAFTVTKIEPAN